MEISKVNADLRLIIGDCSNMTSMSESSDEDQGVERVLSGILGEVVLVIFFAMLNIKLKIVFSR